MKSAGSILERIARVTRVMRLRRHAQAIADAVRAMSRTELLQLRDVVGSIAATVGGDSTARGTPPLKPNDVLDALVTMSVERQLNSDSAIVRIRYIARWLTQTVRLAVGVEEPSVQAIYRKAVAVLRLVQNASEPSRQRSWFIGNDKKVS